MPADEELLRAWAAEERPQPEGWDFSSLDGRMAESIDPWDVPDDFTVHRYAEQRFALHQQGPASGGPFRATRKRFWLKAIKPQSN